MARNLRSSNLESRTARLRLAIQGKPYWLKLAAGLSLGYRRNSVAGAWIVRRSDGKGSAWTKGFATADDHEASDGDTVLTFFEAQTAARSIASGGKIVGKTQTVAGAIERYRGELVATGGNPYNARLASLHTPRSILDKPIQLLSVAELQSWRNALRDGRTPGTVNRIIVCLSAALNLAADLDPVRIAKRPWKVGLKKLQAARRTRNVVLPASQIATLVSLAYDVSPEFGRYIETAATTGARRVQLSRLTVGDLQDAGPSPRLLMPSSAKGKKQKRIERRPVPIPASLASTLRTAAAGRPGSAPLLPKPDGTAWGSCDPAAPFKAIVARAGLDPKIVTPYALRHSSITRGLLANVPVRVVAAQHDTSVQMIEMTYSDSISDHADSLSRAAMLDLGAPRGGNVVPLRGGKG
jgi:integrase